MREGGKRPIRDGGGSSDEMRRAFAVQTPRGTFDGLELALLDPADDDDRALLVRAEHPELAQAIERGDQEIVVDDQAIDPTLHLTIHEIVAKQLWDDDPPEVWQTASRLLGAGYERHEILHMLGWAFAANVRAAFEENDPGDSGYVRALALLPTSWEQQHPSA